MAKVLRAGGEVDAWCTKCRMDLLHRIIAMHGDKIERVECRTCGGHHGYRRPKAEPLPTRSTRAAASAATSVLGSARGAAARKPATLGVRAQAAADAEALRVRGWERAIGGQPLTAFKPYRPTATYAQGDLVRHAKFGDGVIARVVDRAKVEVMFQDGPRTLAQGLDG